MTFLSCLCQEGLSCSGWQIIVLKSLKLKHGNFHFGIPQVIKGQNTFIWFRSMNNARFYRKKKNYKSYILLQSPAAGRPKTFWQWHGVLLVAISFPQQSMHPQTNSEQLEQKH